MKYLFLLTLALTFYSCSADNPVIPGPSGTILYQRDSLVRYTVGGTTDSSILIETVSYDSLDLEIGFNSISYHSAANSQSYAEVFITSDTTTVNRFNMTPDYFISSENVAPNQVSTVNQRFKLSRKNLPTHKITVYFTAFSAVQNTSYPYQIKMYDIKFLKHY